MAYTLKHHPPRQLLTKSKQRTIWRRIVMSDDVWRVDSFWMSERCLQAVWMVSCLDGWMIHGKCLYSVWTVPAVMCWLGWLGVKPCTKVKYSYISQQSINLISYIWSKVMRRNIGLMICHFLVSAVSITESPKNKIMGKTGFYGLSACQGSAVE